MTGSCYAVACLLVFAVTVHGEVTYKDLTVTSLDRTLDMTTQLVKIGIKMTVHNGGKTTASAFHFVIDRFASGKVAHISVKSEKGEAKTLALKGGVTLDDHPEVEAYRVELANSGIPVGQSLIYQVDVVLGKALELYPKQITQKENQLVRFIGNHYAFAPYTCKSQTTKVILPSASIEHHSKMAPTSLSGKIITYGPYTNVAPFSVDQMTVHYENNGPFLIVTKIERVIELSMWGNIAVEEVIDLRHSGAKLKGPFSRFDYQREGAGHSSVKSFKTVLPASASDVYYRDEVGNVSTSALRVQKDAVELELRPRFPLFGGWKTHYMIGYNVPSYEYLFTDGGNEYVLNMRLVDHVHDDMFIEDFTLKIILPEGSEVKELYTPYDVKREKQGLHFTYLDTFGRPTITVKNIGPLTEAHVMNFQLRFAFAKLSMAWEPLLLIVSFFTLFVLTMFYVRLDFAITKDEGKETRLKIAGYCQKISGHHDKRANCYGLFDDAIAKFKTSRDTTAFQNANRKIATDHKRETSIIAELNNSLKKVSPEVSEKVADLQKYDRLYREQQANQGALAEKLVTGKLGKQQFIDQDGAIVKKKDECVERMDAVLTHLQSL